jgi:hypothetical protein
MVAISGVRAVVRSVVSGSKTGLFAGVIREMLVVIRARKEGGDELLRLS